MTLLKDKFLTSFEAAKLLGFSPDHVRRMIGEGKIKAEKVGHNWIINPKDLKHIKRLRYPKIKE